MEDTDEFDENDFDENQVIRIQAFFRGELVRKWFKELKRDYEDLAKDVENNSQINIEWPCAALGLPKICKKRPVPRKNVKDKSLSSSTRSSPNIELTHGMQNGQMKENVTEYRNNHGDLSPRSSILSGLSETSAFKPVISNLTVVETKQSIENIKVDTESQVSRCAMETQTSIDDDFCRANNDEIKSKENQPREIIDKSKPVKTYDMLIQTDDLPSHREQTNNESDTLVHKPAKIESDKSDPLNRELLEQKISKFENQLNSLKQLSPLQTKPEKDDSVPSLTHESMSNSPNQQKERVNLERSPISVPERTFQKSSPNQRRPSYHQESSVLTNVTSVWDSFNSVCKDDSQTHFPEDREGLQKMRKNVAMELLWVQQAIDSRKNYLKLKTQMRTST